MNRITDTCKNITLATTSLRPVIMVGAFRVLILSFPCSFRQKNLRNHRLAPFLLTLSNVELKLYNISYCISSFLILLTSLGNPGSTTVNTISFPVAFSFLSHILQSFLFSQTWWCRGCRSLTESTTPTRWRAWRWMSSRRARRS